MVDVSAKAETERIADRQRPRRDAPETLALIARRRGRRRATCCRSRGSPASWAAKRTPDLIPLCHPLALTSVKVDLTLDAARNAVDIDRDLQARRARTGVEMEALTAVSVAALTVYDMCKAVDRGMRITDIRLHPQEPAASPAPIEAD